MAEFPPVRLYIHCVEALPSLRALGEVIPGFDRYPERALVMARTGDLVCVPRPVDHDYLDFLNTLGMGPTPDHVLALADDEHGVPAGAPLATRLLADPALLARIGAAVPAGSRLELHPYAATPELFTLARALEAGGTRTRVLGGDPAVGTLADQKHVVRAKALALGVPVAEGETVELAGGAHGHGDLDQMRAAIERQLRWTGQVIVRGSSGASGSSTFVVGRDRDDIERLARELSGRADNRVYLVEAMVDVTVSPNLAFRIGRDGTITALGATDQRWGRPLVHAGNVYPSAARLVEDMDAWARLIAASLRDDGYAGDIGFDFVEHRDPRTGTSRAFLAEVNPRVNGANYPLALRERLNAVRHRAGDPPIDACVSGTLATRARHFAELRSALGDHLFTDRSGSGIVPYATGCLAHGRCAAVAFAPTRRQALERYARAEAALEATWSAPSCV